MPLKTRITKTKMCRKKLSRKIVRVIRACKRKNSVAVEPQSNGLNDAFAKLEIK